MSHARAVVPGTLPRTHVERLVCHELEFGLSIMRSGEIGMAYKRSRALDASSTGSGRLKRSVLPKATLGFAAGLTLAFGLLAQANAQQTAAGDPKAGAEKRSQCIGCHGIPGYKASFPRVYNVPMIAGQNAKYIESALNAYRKGDRPHPTMRGIAWSLSDADIADLAAYYASL